VTVVAREDTAAQIARDGVHVDSLRLGSFTVHPPAVASLETAVDVLVVAVKAPALQAALDRVRAEPGLVVPLLNGLDHLAMLRERFAAPVAAGAIRIAAERTAPGRIVHTSPLYRVELAPPSPAVDGFCHHLRMAEVPAVVRATDAEVLWSKLARLNPLALTTAASGRPIGGVLAHPRWRLLLQGAVDETAAVANAAGAVVDAHAVLTELSELAPDQTSSLARDVAAGREHELDAIGGAVLRAAAGHALEAPAVAQLVQAISERVR
jgi:2-dehydropantoate 2-reductase